MDLYERIMELGSMGYHCSQIIMIMTLETIGEENPQLVKAMGGLGGGIGYCGDTCGCLTHPYHGQQLLREMSYHHELSGYPEQTSYL